MPLILNFNFIHFASYCTGQNSNTGQAPSLIFYVAFEYVYFNICYPVLPLHPFFFFFHISFCIRFLVRRFYFMYIKTGNAVCFYLPVFSLKLMFMMPAAVDFLVSS